jgi:NifU-like protein involved in Fe-S cluster formation
VSAQVSERFRNPQRAGRLEGERVARGSGGSVAAGTLIELSLACEQGRILEAAFEAFGCPSAIACGDWLAQWLIGKSLEEAAALRGLQVAEALALAPEKTGVALVAEDALQRAVCSARSMVG